MQLIEDEVWASKTQYFSSNRNLLMFVSYKYPKIVYGFLMNYYIVSMYLQSWNFFTELEGV
jgi:hypothetical protein